MPYLFDYSGFPRRPFYTDEDPETWSDVAEHAESVCEELFRIIQEIARAGCANGVCENSHETARKMRELAREATMRYGVYKREEE